MLIDFFFFYYDIFFLQSISFLPKRLQSPAQQIPTVFHILLIFFFFNGCLQIYLPGIFFLNCCIKPNEELPLVIGSMLFLGPSSFVWAPWPHLELLPLQYKWRAAAASLSAGPRGGAFMHSTPYQVGIKKHQ